ncbi:right-handed parallel beta-helix repeat-containing protein [bacterium]|nr:right-handed parallel beta-helix repeat-containing protein [bacterium]MBU1982996.1 right-handed parallel beta-helix repeat-containing protein [bacterium]
MRQLLAIVLLLVCAGVSFSQLSGPLSGTLGPGWYTVIGDIQVDTSAALTILAPTTLDFQDTFSFKVYGVLTAGSQSGGNVLFTTSRTAPNRWRGLRFLGPASTPSQLTYCIIENGWATGPTLADQCGGGVYIYQSSPTFLYCSMHNNYADACGGGVYSEYSRAVFDTCSITWNTAFSSHPANFWGGGGVLCVYGAERFTFCIITNNVTIMGNGGGAWIERDSALFNDCEISFNSALSLDGGGVYCFWYAVPTFTNCGISADTAMRDGGGTWCDNTSSPTYNFCTLSDNVAGGSGGGAFCQDSPPPMGPAYNSCIVAYSMGEGIYFLNSSGSAISYGDFFGNSAGDFGGAVPPGLNIISGVNANGDPCDAFTNIFGDPSFVYRPYDLHLQTASRCIAAADPLLPVFTDFESDVRPNPPGSSPDIGMDENPLGVPGGALGPITDLVIRPDFPGTGNVILYWSPVAGATFYTVYGKTTPGATGTPLASGVTGSAWMDNNTSSRPSPYFYYVTVVSP